MMAWRMEYRSKGCGLPSSPMVPKSSRVLALGVAVKAMKERLSRLPWDETSCNTETCAASASVAAASSKMAASSSICWNSSSVILDRPSRVFSAFLPVWEECASSTITAKVRSATSVSR